MIRPCMPSASRIYYAYIYARSSSRPRPAWPGNAAAGLAGHEKCKTTCTVLAKHVHQIVARARYLNVLRDWSVELCFCRVSAVRDA
eukprot:496555-Heterocapsa_arctica.AAC.1